MAKKNLADKCVVVRIPDFEKRFLNGKTGPQHWYACSASQMTDARFVMLTATAKLLWFFVLGEATRDRLRDVYVHPRGVLPYVHGKLRSVLRAVQELVDIEYIQVLKDPYNTVQYSTIHTHVRSLESSPPPPDVLFLNSSDATKGDLTHNSVARFDARAKHCHPEVLDQLREGLQKLMGGMAPTSFLRKVPEQLLILEQGNLSSVLAQVELITREPAYQDAKDTVDKASYLRNRIEKLLKQSAGAGHGA